MSLHHNGASHAEQAVFTPRVSGVLRSPGRPLDRKTRAFFESRFGHDFGKVRLHTDSRADESARAMRARAYTAGQNIVFREGEYAPRTAKGRLLLAHELSHVVQQSCASVFSKAVSSLSDASEREAERAATKIVSGHTTSARTTERPARIQRQGDLTLTTPQLGAPPHQPGIFSAGEGPYLHLDPWVRVYSVLDPDSILHALMHLDLSSLTAVPPPPALQFPTTPPAKPAPLVPRGTGPAPPRAASVGDVLSGFAAVPAVKAKINWLRDTASTQARQDWQSLSTGGKALTIGTTALIAGGTVAGILGNDSSRQWALHFIQGKNIPVPFMPELSIQVNPVGPNQSVMMHLDLSSLARKLGK